jgi:hypothetical protein
VLNNILVIGSGGNLGNYFCENSIHKNLLMKIQRDEFLSKDFTIAPGKAIRLSKNISPDLIINFANAYFAAASPSQVEIMRSAIVGVAESISLTSSNYSIPVISFSSHFQYPPMKLRPWSAYAQLKDQGVVTLKTKASSFVEITLRDNYGGRRKDKFFDLALISNHLGTSMDANQGESLLNLTNIGDLCRGIDSVISNLHSLGKYEHFEMKNHKSFSLKEVISIIDLETGRKTKVNWGVLPYREKEVFEDWKCADAFQNWQPDLDINSYIRGFTI